MTSPTPRLEAALAQFAAQPGVTADQEAQLRTAVTRDADLLALLNRQADAGQLTAFALEAPGGPANRVGTYDKAAGVVTLPRASFYQGESVPTDDLNAVLGVQSISVDFAHKSWQDASGATHPVDQDMVDNLQSTLNLSPVLADQVKDAWSQSHVRHFSLLPHGAAAGGTYDGHDADGTPKGINLPPLGLQTRSSATPQGRFDPQDMTFVLGHEVQHGFNDAATDARADAFMQAIARESRVQGPVHDYSDELRDYIRGVREDEAIANIAGWNALLSRERELQPNANGLDVMIQVRNKRLDDFIEPDPSNQKAARPKPGYTFNPDGSLTPTAANIEAAAQHFFDLPSRLYASPGQRSVGLGEGKPPSDDYTNFYGNWALERIFQAEDRANVQYNGARPQIAIDMAGIGLKEDLLERGGLDLGTDKTPRSYLDTSTAQPTPGLFHHTQDASMGHGFQHVPIAASGDPAVDRWIDALQDGNSTAAREAQQSFARSADGQALWDAWLAEARSAQAVQRQDQEPALRQAGEHPHRPADPHAARPAQQLAQDEHPAMVR